MPDANHDNSSFFWKIAVYVIGCIIGVGAKLASLRRERVVTMTDAIVETLIAGAASFFVWMFCHIYLKQDDFALIASVIVGRFGDDILFFALSKIKNIIKKLGDK